MAEKKNQHFVPQFYLRNFSKDENSIGISFHIDTPNPSVNYKAPISRQASHDYYYTSDTSIEDDFQLIETPASQIINRIISEPAIVLNDDEIYLLKHFIYIQHIRTPMHAQMLEDTVNQMYHKLAGPDYDEIDVKVKDAPLRTLVYLSKLAYQTVEPLKLVILDNRTPLPFITAPDPSIYFNLYCMRRNEEYGTAMPGLMFYMPISAKKAIFLYDPNVYKVKEKHMVSCDILEVAFLNFRIYNVAIKSPKKQIYFDNRTEDYYRDFELWVNCVEEAMKKGVDLMFPKERGCTIWSKLISFFRKK